MLSSLKESNRNRGPAREKTMTSAPHIELDSRVPDAVDRRQIRAVAFQDVRLEYVTGTMKSLGLPTAGSRALVVGSGRGLLAGGLARLGLRWSPSTRRPPRPRWHGKRTSARTSPSCMKPRPLRNSAWRTRPSTSPTTPIRSRSPRTLTESSNRPPGYSGPAACHL